MMKYILILVVVIQGCVNTEPKFDRINIYDMRTQDNVPSLLVVNNSEEISKELQEVHKNGTEVKIKVYPVYKVELFTKSKKQVYLISGHIVKFEGKTYKTKLSLQDLIAANNNLENNK